MKITANSIRVGNILEISSRLYVVNKPPEHTMPGKGGAFVQVEMKAIKSGTKLNTRFRSTEYVEKVRLDQQQYQYLYIENDFVTLMDKNTYEQIQIDKALFRDQIDFLRDGMDVEVEFYQEKPINIRLPEQIDLIIDEAEPVVKNQTVTSSFKPATLENGVRIMVPQFINSGDKITVKIEDRSYVGRVK